MPNADKKKCQITKGLKILVLTVISSTNVYQVQDSTLTNSSARLPNIWKKKMQHIHIQTKANTKQ